MLPLFQSSVPEARMAATYNQTLHLMMEETAEVNSQDVLASPSLNLSLCLITTVINIWAISVIRNKDKSGLNRLLIADCVANILWSPLVSFFCVITLNISVFFLVNNSSIIQNILPSLFL